MNIPSLTSLSSIVQEGFQKIREKNNSHPAVFPILLALGTLLAAYKYLSYSNTRESSKPVDKSKTKESTIQRPWKVRLTNEQESKKSEEPKNPCSFDGTNLPKQEEKKIVITQRFEKETSSVQSIPNNTEVLESTTQGSEEGTSPDHSITGEISLDFLCCDQKLFKHAREKGEGIDLRTIFLGEKENVKDVFSSVFKDSHDDNLGTSLEQKVKGFIFINDQLKNSNGEAIQKDPDHLYFAVNIKSYSGSSEIKLNLPSYLLFDPEGQLIDPICFSLDAHDHCLSLQASLKQCQEAYGQHYFTSESILQLRKFVCPYYKEWNALLQENNIFSFVSLNALEFGKSDDSSLTLIPYKEKKVPRGSDIEPLLYKIGTDETNESYIMHSFGHGLDALLDGKIRIILDKEHKDIWIFMDKNEKFSQFGEDFTKRHATIIHPSREVDFERASLKYISGLLELSFPYHTG